MQALTALSPLIAVLTAAVGAIPVILGAVIKWQRWVWYEKPMHMLEIEERRRLLGTRKEGQEGEPPALAPRKAKRLPSRPPTRRW